MLNLTSHQYYRGLNRKFDRRAARLRSLGFAYKALPEYGVAIFTRNKFGRVQSIPASTLHHADNRAFIDGLKMFCR